MKGGAKEANSFTGIMLNPDPVGILYSDIQGIDTQVMCQKDVEYIFFPKQFDNCR